MEVRVAKSAGFCFGVKRACEAVSDLLPQNRLYLLGELIHNKRVMSEFKNKGARLAEDINEIPNDGVAVIRAHGVPCEIIDRLNDKKIKICDQTCPYVKKIHGIVNSESKKGRKIIIFGKKEHPEVIGISGWCENAIVASSFDDILDKIEAEDEISVVAQTTVEKEKFYKFIKFLKKACNSVSVFDTICQATKIRQEETIELAKNCDLMVIIGGKNSSNTLELYNKAKSVQENTILIEDGDLEQLKNILYIQTKKIKVVGVTAGASTPSNSIEEVIAVCQTKEF